MHILVIEDNPDLVANLVDYLEGRGHVLEAAYDGWSGLQQAMDGPFDAVVLDLMLPGIDGVEVCRRLREAGRSLPVLMLTARDTLEDKLQGFAGGADDYLVKPFDLDELNARVAAVARRATGDPSPVVRMGEIEIDQTGREIRRDGQRIDITGREWAVLDQLLGRRNRIVTKEQIEEALYPFGAEIESNAIEVHVSRLRKKLGRDFIETVRGVGYRLGAG